MNINRTDLALEDVGAVDKAADGISMSTRDFGDASITSVEISPHGEKRTGRASGSYITVTLDAPNDTAEQLLEKALLRLLKSDRLDRRKILVCGLGNASITPDSLGVRTASGILATAHLKRLSDSITNEVYVLSAGVTAQTGLESSRIIRTLCDELKPDFVIAIDALACREKDRLCRTIQLTDTGISPGSGVGNNREELSEKALGAPCIAVGVPTVIDFEGEMMVCPRDIDVKIRGFAKLISSALNSIFCPKLTKEDISELLFA